MKLLKLKLFAISIGILFGFIVGEVFARIYFFGSAAFSYSKVNSFGILDNSGLIQYSQTEGLKYELLPNLNTKYKLVDFNTNKEGFRDCNHLFNDTTTKIAIIGDSFTMGTGVSEKGLYAQKTGELLQSLQPHRKYEVFNFGVSGYTLQEYITILKKNVIKYKPDLVVIGFCASNDQYKVGVDYTLDDFTIKDKKNVFWYSYLRKLLQIKLRKKQAPIAYETSQLLYVNEQLEELQQLLKAQNIKGIILYLDLMYDAARVSQIKELTLTNDLLFLDTSNWFHHKNLNPYIVNELDPHPNDKANLIFANYLSDFIIKNEKNLFKN